MLLLNTSWATSINCSGGHIAICLGVVCMRFEIILEEKQFLCYRQATTFHWSTDTQCHVFRNPFWSSLITWTYGRRAIWWSVFTVGSAPVIHSGLCCIAAYSDALFVWARQWKRSKTQKVNLCNFLLYQVMIVIIIIYHLASKLQSYILKLRCRLVGRVTSGG